MAQRRFGKLRFYGFYKENGIYHFFKPVLLIKPVRRHVSLGKKHNMRKAFSSQNLLYFMDKFSTKTALLHFGKNPELVDPIFRTLIPAFYFAQKEVIGYDEQKWERKEERHVSDNWVVQNLQNSLESWNSKLSEVWRLLTQSPEEFRGGGIWSVIQDIHGALLAIGLALLVLFFVAGVVKTCGSFAEVNFC